MFCNLLNRVPHKSCDDRNRLAPSFIGLGRKPGVDLCLSFGLVMMADIPSNAFPVGGLIRFIIRARKPDELSISDRTGSPPCSFWRAFFICLKEVSPIPELKPEWMILLLYCSLQFVFKTVDSVRVLDFSYSFLEFSVILNSVNGALTKPDFSWEKINEI